MSPEQVRKVLDSIGTFRYLSGPYGFTIVCGKNSNGAPIPKYRIECGSGIAGRGGAWSLVFDIPTGERTAFVTTQRELRRLIVEQLTYDAGAWGEFKDPKPEPKPGYEVYARLNRNRLGGGYIWVQRRIRVRSKKG